MSLPRTHHRWWLLDYHRADLPADLLAGAVVAVLLVPQSMAYALLAGLPPQVGLYASVVPVALYGLAGRGRLSVAPTAITSLLVGSALAPLAAAGSLEAVGWALSLALLVGATQLLLGLLRAGFLANLLGHSVISGFTSAAALVIATGQLPSLAGLPTASGSFGAKLLALARGLGQVHAPTLVLGGGAVALLLLVPRFADRWLRRLRIPAAGRSALARGGPLAAVVLGTLAVQHLSLEGVAVVGKIPAGLPSLTLPGLAPEALRTLLPSALAIALVSFVESFAIAKALAARHRERVEADAVLRGLGTANLGSAFTGGYPVTGGLGRSTVNDEAGAKSGMASLVTAGLVALTLAFLTPAFRSLPRAVLAAIILVAVSRLFDPSSFRRLWRYSTSDALAWAVTFVAVLVEGVELGILTGVAAAIALHLARTSRPHVAVVGRLGDGEHFRNVLRHPVRTWPDLLLVRVDESLYFANAAYLEGRLLEMVAQRPAVRHLVLIASAVNLIDGGALESLDRLTTELRQAGVTLHLAEVKGPVMDRLARTDFLHRLAPGRVFLSTHEAVLALAQEGGADAVA